MSSEETIVQELTKKFPALADKTKVQRARRIWVETEYSAFESVFNYIVNTLKFPVFCTLTGLDENENIALLYHLANDKGVVLNLKTFVPKTNPVIKTITKTFPQAALSEREVIDLLGVKVEGIPPGKRYPLPDDWPIGEHPLRKDWKPGVKNG